MKKINEIFYSLQGEGFHTGTPAVFVRLSGCNLRCPFCDTQHESGTMMSDEDIVKEVKRYPAHIVVLTGGEPALQLDKALVDALHHAGLRVHIETNGTHALPSGIDWITCSPKETGKMVLQHIDELKVVYQGQALEQYAQYPTPHKFLQPCSNKNVQETVEAVKSHPEWRLSLQTHIIVGIR